MMISQQNQDIYKRVNSGKIIFRYNFFFKTFSKKIFEKIDFSNFLFFYIFRNVISNQKKVEKIFFLKKLKIMICLFHRNGKIPFWKWP